MAPPSDTTRPAPESGSSADEKETQPARGTDRAATRTTDDVVPDESATEHPEEAEGEEEAETSDAEDEAEDEDDAEEAPAVARPARRAAQSPGRDVGAKKSGKRKKTSAGRATGKGRKEPEEYEPVFSGRLVAAAALCLAMVFIPLSPLGRIIAKDSPESQAREAWRVGTRGHVHITVVTADFDKLACADEREIEGMHCTFKTDTETFPLPPVPFDDNKKSILQPYRTTDGQLLFMAGLWAQPEVAMRLHNEPARNVAEKSLARFVADCEVDFLAEWQGTKFRWAPRDKWSSGETGMVARPVGCRVFQGEER